MTMTGSTEATGRMLNDPDGWARDFERVVKDEMKKAGEFMLRAVVGPKGTLKNSPTGFKKTIFQGQLQDDLSSRGVQVEGDLRTGITASFGSTLPYAPVIEYGRKPGGKHPPKSGEKKTFSVPAKTHKVKAHTRKGGAKVKGHSRTTKPRKVTIETSVLDPWIKHGRRMAVKGEGLAAYRKRAGIAYLLGRKWKRSGQRGKRPIGRALAENKKELIAMLQSGIVRGAAKISRGRV